MLLKKKIKFSISLSCLASDGLHLIDSIRAFSNLMFLIMHCKLFKHLVLNAAVMLTKTLYILQIIGPVSFRVDSGITVDLKNPDWPIRAQEPVFALEYALQVLGSAKAVAWYSPKRQEFMAELRFYET